jgi:Protein of unknown function (DUF3987)
MSDVHAPSRMGTCPRCGLYAHFEDDSVVCATCLATNTPSLLAQADRELSSDETDWEHTEGPLPPLEPALPPEGLIAETSDYLTKATMNPPEFSLAISLFDVSAILCGQVTIGLGDNEWPPALWPVLVADPAGLKSAALRSGTRLLDDATGGSLRLAEDFTPEALHANLADRPQGYMEHSEFGAFVNAVRRKDYLGGTFDFMNRVYDGETAWSLRKTEGLTKAHRVAVAMLSGTTWTALKTWVRADLLMEGFLTRPLYVPQLSKSQYVGLQRSGDTQPLRERRNHIVRQLAELHKGARYTNAPTVRFDQVASAMWDMRDEPWREEDVDVNLSGLAKRRGGTALRLAVCYAAARTLDVRDLEVTSQDMFHALAFVDFCSQRMFPVIEDTANQSKSGQDLDRVFKLIRRTGAKREGGWVNRRELMRLGHLTKWDFERLAESLIEAELIEQGSGNRRDSVTYRVMMTERGFARP